MSLLITLVGVLLGNFYAGWTHRRFGADSWRGWLLIAPVVLVYVVVLLTTDTAEPVPRAVQAFTIAAVLRTTLESWRARREHRQRVDDAAAAERAREEAEVRRSDQEAAGRLQVRLPRRRT